MKYSSPVSRLTTIAVLVSVGLVLYLVEGMIPVPIPVPGAKLGLANIVTILSIVLLGPVDALFVVTLRCFLGSLLGGNLTAFWFSMAGAFLATTVMSVAYYQLNRYLSLAGVSVLGGVFHNIGQLFVAAVVIRNFGIYFYLPFLLLAGIGTGYFVGLSATMVLKALEATGLSRRHVAGGQVCTATPDSAGSSR